MKRGRPPKTTAEHEADGTLRPGRHDDRQHEPKAQGAPVAPDWIAADEVAHAHWLHVVDECERIGICLGTIDSSALALLCETWSQLTRLRALEKAEGLAKFVYLISRTRSDWHKQASALGLNPTARVGMVSHDSKGAEDELAGVVS